MQCDKPIKDIYEENSAVARAARELLLLASMPVAYMLVARGGGGRLSHWP
jgi:hypothetical protein